MKQDPLPPKTNKSLSAGAWRVALLTCLDNWNEQKAEFEALWKAMPEFVTAYAHPDWLSQMQAELEANKPEALRAGLEIAPHKLTMTWPKDDKPGVVKFDDQNLELSAVDFGYLYTVAFLQQEPEPGLLNPKRIYAHILALFPEPDEDDTEEKTLRKAFEMTLEQVLNNMESTLGKASGQRWRHLLMSQARRYASGLDDASSFELLSELRQHRDLLELMIQRFEQQAGLQPLETTAARLYRFFVSDPESLEIRHRLGAYVGKYLVRVHKALQAVQQQSKTMGCPEEILWGKPESRLWQEATTQGYALSKGVVLEIEAPPPGVLPVEPVVIDAELLEPEEADEAADEAAALAP